MIKNLLSVENLTLEDKFSSKELLKKITFDLQEKEILGIIGESGSGKTLLSQAIVNWLPENLQISNGSINFLGRNINHLNENELERDIRGQQIAYIGPNAINSLDPTYPVGYQLLEKAISVDKKNTSKKILKEKVIDLLDDVLIPSPQKRFHEYPSQFSGGMMQRAMIVDALLSSPKLLVADNITMPLDVTVAAQIIKLIKTLRDKFETTIIFSSSSLPVVNEAADNIIVIKNGSLEEKNTSNNILSNPKSDHTKNLIKKTPKIWSEKTNFNDNDGNPIISIKNFSKSYKVRDKNKFNSFYEVKAVRDFSIDVYEGENLGIIGESGCGKSTLSRLITLLEKSDSGKIFFQGEDLTSLTKDKLKNFRQSLQLILQDPYNSLPSRQTIGRIISEGLLIHSTLSKSQIKEKVLSTMQEVGISPDDYNNLLVGKSGSFRQRVSIARALILEPKVIILDETLSSLDQNEQEKLLNLFNQIQIKRKLTYIFISHDLAMVRKSCNRIAVMYMGRTVELAKNEILFNHCGHPYTRTLLCTIPTLDQNPYDKKIYLMDGEPPDPTEIDNGCSFRSRCPHPTHECKEGSIEMGLIEVEPGHWVDKCCVNCA
jgi:peptide/nickel transport system ATP-binding protein